MSIVNYLLLVDRQAMKMDRPVVPELADLEGAIKYRAK